MNAIRGFTDPYQDSEFGKTAFSLTIPNELLLVSGCQPDSEPACGILGVQREERD